MVLQSPSWPELSRDCLLQILKSEFYETDMPSGNQPERPTTDRHRLIDGGADQTELRQVGPWSHAHFADDSLNVEELELFLAVLK